MTGSKLGFKSGFLSLSLVSLGSVVLVGCQSNLSQEPTQPRNLPKTESVPQVKTPESIKITPYERPEIKREQLQVVIPRKQKTQQNFDDGRQLPAFKQLMQQTQTAFKQSKWNEAEQAAMHAQRLAPQSAETYMYLAMISNHKNQAANAESLARRGLSYAQTNTMKRQLWQIILKSAQTQKNTKTMQEAQARIQTL